MQKVQIFIGVASSKTPGPGAWFARLQYQGKTRKLEGTESCTVEDRLSLVAVVTALECLKHPCQVEVFSNSTYLQEGAAKKWIQRYRTEENLRNTISERTNVEIWGRFAVLSDQHEISFRYIPLEQKSSSSSPRSKRRKKKRTRLAS